MADSDSDASSTTSDTLLIVRPASSVKPDAVRYERCYSRKLLLQLSKSDKIRPPTGLKPLSEWYGEYELPSVHPVNSTGRYAGRDAQAGGRRERERERGTATGAAASSPADRYSNEKESSTRPTSGAPATGQMGDFRLAGQRPFTLPKDGDSGDALSAGSRRRPNPRDLDTRERELDGKDRNWAATGAAAAADRRRQLGGEFVKKDGRAAEEGGWRSSRETMQLGRERPQRDRLDRIDRPGYNDRDSRSGAMGGSDRRRQPAWMDEDESSSSPKYGNSSTYQRRGQNGQHMHDATPAWMADEPTSSKGRADNSLEALESSTSTGMPSSEASHVDSIQAFKAQMKEMERRKKVQEQKELRREMGLPEMPDEDYAKKAESDSTGKAPPQQPSQAAAPPKSVFAEFLLPSSSSKEKELNKVAEEKPRSSRFARMFAAEAAAASQASDRASPAGGSAAASPSPIPSGTGHVPHSSSSNNLLAALLPGAARSPAPQVNQGNSSPAPAATQTDNQSMARLMEMLHMSSAAPPSAPSIATMDGKLPENAMTSESGAANGQNRSSSSSRVASQPSRSKGQAPVDIPLHDSRNGLYSPDFHGVANSQAQQVPPRHQGQPSSAQHLSPQQSRDTLPSPHALPQSRLANRTSAYNLNTSSDGPSPSQNARRQEPLHAPVPPDQGSVNLLQLLGGQMSPPAGALPPHLQNFPSPSQHQQQQQHLHSRGQPMQSPPSNGPFTPMGGSMPDHQHSQMAAFLQAQAGGAGRPLPPPGVPGAGNMQFGRPVGQGPFLPSQGPYPPHQGPFPPPLQQHQQPQHAGHMRTPSGHMNAASLLQQQQRLPHNPQQQQQPFNPMRNDGSTSQPLPPPQAFAQQNALAQLLAQGGHPGQQFAGMRPPSNGTLSYQQQQQHPPPPMHMQQTSPMHMHHSSPPPNQQNQIDLMALLTGGSNVGGFAGR